MTKTSRWSDLPLEQFQDQLDDRDEELPALPAMLPLQPPVVLSPRFGTLRHFAFSSWCRNDLHRGGEEKLAKSVTKTGISFFFPYFYLAARFRQLLPTEPYPSLHKQWNSGMTSQTSGRCRCSLPCSHAKA